MDNIYRSASLTIVAAAGSDANAGLPDVRRPRTVTQHVAMVKGYELTTVPELPTFAIESSGGLSAHGHIKNKHCLIVCWGFSLADLLQLSLHQLSNPYLRSHDP